MQRPAAELAGDGGELLARFVERLAGISAYFDRYAERRGGSLRCDRHPRVTHWGQLAYGLQIDGFLFERTGDEEYLRRALRMLAHLRDQLRVDEGKYVFYPGRLNRYNASNNAIDSGAVSDSLAYWYGRFAAATPPALLDFIRDACSKVASTYLRFAGDKLTNQALWAMTGLAAVHRFVEPSEEYRAACIDCLQQSFGDQNRDGSFPYLPHRLAGQDSPSLHDVSGFYHSRHVSFILDVADKIDWALGDAERERVVRAADFLAALYRPDGGKSLEIEAKHWYWMGDESSEPASASFDYHALSECHRRWRLDHHLAALSQAATSFLENAGDDGAVRARAGDRDFQCTHFWSAHAAWVTKALDAYVPSLPSPPPPPAYDGDESGLVCRRSGGTSLQLRARKAALTPLFGGYACGVTWLSLAAATSDNLLSRRRWSLDAPGEVWQLPLSGLLRDLLVGGGRRFLAWRSEYRFLLALVYQSALVGRFGQTLYLLREAIGRRSLFLLAPIHASFWSLESRWSWEGGVLTLAAPLARGDGSSAGGAWCERRIEVGADRIDVQLRVENGPRPSLFFFPLPPGAAVRVEPAGRSRRLRRGLLLRLRAGESVRVAYEIRSGDGAPGL